MRLPLGTWALIRLALRRDRILLPAWIIGFAVAAGGSAGATKDLYPQESLRIAAASTINSTAGLVAIYGPIFDPSSLGALSMFKLTSFGAALVAILMVIIVVRHTRAEEEAGRLELVGSGTVSRNAPLLAAVMVAAGASLALGLGTAGALIAAGLPVVGSLAFGAGWASAGMVFGAAAAVFAQIASSARAATGLGMVSIGAAYVLRAVGDVRGSDLTSMFSPIGWGSQIRAFAGDRFSILVVPALAIGGLTWLAFQLRARRDLGAGLFVERAGRATGIHLGSAVGLAWRLQRGMLAVWIVGFAALGYLLGSIAHMVTGLMSSPAMAKFLMQLGGVKGLTDAFLSAEMGIVGIVAAGYGIAACLRMRTEESAGHLEAILSTRVGRVSWAGGHIGIAVVGVTAILGAAGFSAGIAHSIAVGDAGQISRVGLAALIHAPAAWVLVGIAVALFGLVPRVTSLAWGALIGFIFLGEFGKLLSFPGWLIRLSPFAHVPALPGGAVSVVPIATVTAVALGLTVVGLVALRRRDLAA